MEHFITSLIGLLTLALTLFNSLVLVGYGVFYFFKNYEILPKETYNALVEMFEEQQKEEQKSTPLEGGCGDFFRDQIEEYDKKEEEEEEEDEWN